MAYLELSGLTKRYGGTAAADHVSLGVERGECVALLGPSGCGKTTTLRMIAGLVTPDGGVISLDGADITRKPAHQRNMGYVFQSYALFPHLTVAGNIGFGLEERRAPRAEIERRVGQTLELVRLEGLGHRRPRELSGGQQQRVALARALVIEPAVLLLDESLSNLDARLRDAMRHEIRGIQRSLGITTLLVTHDQAEALTMCDRIAVMNKGRIAQTGAPHEIYERPADRFVAEFVGRGNFAPARRASDGTLSMWGARLPLSAAAPGEMDVFIRPQRIRLTAVSEPAGADMARVTGRVLRSIFAGDHVEVILAGAEGELTIEMPSGAPPPPDGAELAAVWNAADMRLFARGAAP